MHRISIVGVTGTGKTTFARSLAKRLDIPHVELDALYWGPNWTPADPAVFRLRVDEVLMVDSWVVDGNYSRVRDLVWGRADTMVWLDYPLSMTLWRLLLRTVRRVSTKEDLWGGNRERATQQFLSRGSLFLWALQSHARYRREYPLLLSSDGYAHLRSVRLRSPGAAAKWMNSLP
jgi:adenylate kinase family enzyme